MCNHDWEPGAIEPPYTPPRCRLCGEVLATRAGISYAEFMSKAARLFDIVSAPDFVPIKTEKLETGTIPTETITPETL